MEPDLGPSGTGHAHEVSSPGPLLPHGATPSAEYNSFSMLSRGGAPDTDVWSGNLLYGELHAVISPGMTVASQTHSRSAKELEGFEQTHPAAGAADLQTPTDALMSEFYEDFLSPAAASLLDEYANNPDFLASQEELRSLLFATAQSTVPTRAASPDNAQDASASIEGYEKIDCMKAVLTTKSKIDFLRNYINEVAPWLDMFDAKRTFGTQLLVISQHSPALLYAVLALSARQQERKHQSSKAFDSLEFYQEAIKLLTPLLSSRNPHAIAVCVILCCLEMMSCSQRDWRRHLEGCASLFDAMEITGFSGGLHQAVFWCYARMDLCGALISDGTESTLLELSKWVPTDTPQSNIADLFAASGLPDMHANYAVYLCSAVCGLISDRTGFTELGLNNGCTFFNFAQRWNLLWNDLQKWLATRPSEMVPVKTVPQRKGKPFPSIFFTHWAAISSSQLYHTACILLLQSRPRDCKLPSTSISSALWHARHICGISMTNPHQGCLNNAIQPLWVAGKLLGHESEHRELVTLIRRIEATTGWAMSWRIKDLEEAWGSRALRTAID